MVGRKAFVMNPKHQCHLSQWVEWVFSAQSWKERRLLCEFIFVPIEKWTLTLKNGHKGSFSYETKASMSFIPIRRMSLWFLIRKRKQIIMWIHVYPNWQMKFDSKKWWEEKLFLWIQSIDVIYPNEENRFMVPNYEKKEIIMWLRVCRNLKISFNSKKWQKEKLFLWNQSTNFIYHN